MIKFAGDNDAFLRITNRPFLALHKTILGLLEYSWSLPALQVLSLTWKKYAGDLSEQVTSQS